MKINACRPTYKYVGFRTLELYKCLNFVTLDTKYQKKIQVASVKQMMLEVFLELALQSDIFLSNVQMDIKYAMNRFDQLTFFPKTLNKFCAQVL